MSQANKDIALTFLTALGSGDSATMRSIISDDIKAICTGTSILAGTRNHAEILGALEVFPTVTKGGLRFEIISMTAEEDRVAVETKGHCELVTGAAYNNEYHFLFKIRDGRIYEMKEYMDSLLTQTVLAPLFTAAA